MMNTSRRTLILMCVFVIVFIVCLVEIADGKSEDEGIREITVVTITPRETEAKEETVNFDLQHLAIAGRDVKDGSNANGNDTEEPEPYGEHPGADGAGPEISDTDAFGDEADPEGLEGSVYPEGDTGDEDWEDNVPTDGAGSADTAGEETGSVDPMPELLEPGPGGSGDGSEPEEGLTDDEGWVYYANCRITHYCPCAACCGEWATGYTANGSLATEGRTVATGEDIPFGTEVMINGQVYIAEDRGVGYGEIDVFVNDHQTALNMGQYYTDVYVRYAD